MSLLGLLFGADDAERLMKYFIIPVAVLFYLIERHSENKRYEIEYEDYLRTKEADEKRIENEAKAAKILADPIDFLRGYIDVNKMSKELDRDIEAEAKAQFRQRVEELPVEGRTVSALEGIAQSIERNISFFCDMKDEERWFGRDVPILEEERKRRIKDLPLGKYTSETVHELMHELNEQEVPLRILSEYDSFRYEFIVMGNESRLVKDEFMDRVRKLSLTDQKDEERLRKIAQDLAEEIARRKNRD